MNLGRPNAWLKVPILLALCFADSDYDSALPLPIRLAALLMPELESELARTRYALERVPETRGGFKSHQKSRSLASLAGHTADLVCFVEMVLTRAEFDFGFEHRTPLVMESAEQPLAAFDESAKKTLDAFKGMTDERFLEDFGFFQRKSGFFRLTLHGVSCQHARPYHSPPRPAWGLPAAD